MKCVSEGCLLYEGRVSSLQFKRRGNRKARSSFHVFVAVWHVSLYFCLFILLSF